MTPLSKHTEVLKTILHSYTCDKDITYPKETHALTYFIQLAKKLEEGKIAESLHKWKERWLLCWGGEPDGSCFDCACCLDDKSDKDCQCICHRREKELSNAILSYLTEEKK